MTHRQYESNGFRVVEGNGWRMTANPGGRPPEMTCMELARTVTTSGPHRFSDGTEFRLLDTQDWAVVDQGHRILVERVIPDGYGIVGSVSFTGKERHPDLSEAITWTLTLLEVAGKVRHCAGSHHRGPRTVWHEDVRHVMLTSSAVEEGWYEDRWLARDRDEVRSIILDQAFDQQTVNHGDWHVWQVEGIPATGRAVPERIADSIVTQTSSDRDRDSFSIEWVPTAINHPVTRRARFLHGHATNREE